jgi:hypothetical protein
MSHFTRVRLELRDRAALVAALRELGWNVEEHATPVMLRGYYAGDHRSAEIVMSKGVNAKLRYADAGFARETDGAWTLIADSMEPNLGNAFREDLMQLAGLHAAERIAAEQGYVTERERLANGDIDLIVTGYA